MPRALSIVMPLASVLIAGTAIGHIDPFAQLPKKQSNAGDSISQGFDANAFPTDHPNDSWVQGTRPEVDSVYSRFLKLNPTMTQQPESVTGSEMVSGDDNFAAQASRICNQSVVPNYVSVLLGGNDVCNAARSTTADATANMYSIETWLSGVRAGFDQLAECLPSGSTVQVMSVPRVDSLYEAGHAKGLWCGDFIWPVADICRIITNEPDASRRAQVARRIDEYNDALAAEVTVYSRNTNRQNPKGIRFVSEWKGSIEAGFPNTSIGTVLIQAADIDSTDCFHPVVAEQAKFACVAWASNPYGSGTAAQCLQ